MCFRLQTVVWKFLWRDWTFSLAACRESSCFSNSSRSVRPGSPCPPPDSQETSRGETAVRRPSSNTGVWNFVKSRLRRLGRLHKRHQTASRRRSPRPEIVSDASVPHCWWNNEQETNWRTLSHPAAPNISPPFTDHRSAGNPLISRLELKIPTGNSLHQVICLKVCRKLSKK